MINDIKLDNDEKIEKIKNLNDDIIISNESSVFNNTEEIYSNINEFNKYKKQDSKEYFKEEYSEDSYEKESCEEESCEEESCEEESEEDSEKDSEEEINNDNITDKSNKSSIQLNSEEKSNNVSSSDMSSEYELILNNSIIRHYNILYKLGGGNYSTVWLAYDTLKYIFVAFKIQKITNINTILEEFQFINKLPKKSKVFNHVLEYFVKTIEGIKYMCSTWKLHYTNLDTIIRKYNNQTGLPLEQVKCIMRQIIKALDILHNRVRAFHGDIKSDNILVKGINRKDKFVTSYYIKEFDRLVGNRDLSKDELYEIHQKISTEALNSANKFNLENPEIIIQNLISEEIKISVADFDTFCDSNMSHTSVFGTRYYQAPEIILQGECWTPVDIWALGCTFFELLSGKFLFNPKKCSNYSRDYYHLSLMIDTCGKFPYNFLLKTKNYRKYFKYNRLENYKLDKDNRLYNRVNTLPYDKETKKTIYILLSKMLKLNPATRCNIKYLMNHNFFK